MIDRDGGFYYLICDVCGEEAPASFCEFQEAVRYKKAEGWRSRRRDGEWEDVCPDCQEMCNHDWIKCGEGSTR